MKVMVIGAGLGGLCLAQGLTRAGIEVELYERDPGITARFQGYRIGLSEQGITALHGCLPPRLHPLLDAVQGDLAGERRFLDPLLAPVREMPPLRATAVDRHVLRHLLLAGLDGRVRTGKQLIGYDVLADGRVRACFADGTAATGDVLVGADGVGSAVRAVLAPEVVPIDTGCRAVIGRTPLTERFAALVPGFGTGIEGETGLLMLGLMKFRVPPAEAAARLAPEVALPDVRDYVRWVMMLPPSHTGEGAVDTVLDLMDGWHPDLRALVAAADPDNSALIEIRVVKPSGRWARGPVTLLGDAIHATSPSGGNGANTALYDADLVRRKLIDVAEGRASLLTALDDYETRMFEYGSQAVEYSLAALKQFQPA